MGKWGNEEMNRVVAITGASSGIGLAVARECVRRGHAVALAARRADRLAAAVDALRAAGGRALFVTGDVQQDADMQHLVDTCVREFGRLDVMVANAGIGYHDQFEATPVDVMRRLIDVNVMGTLLAARAAAIQFRRQGSGHLIAVSSIVGRRGIAGSSVYSATKAAQAGLIEALRAEWLHTGLHATAVYPVSTATEFHDAIEREHGYRVKGLGPKQTAESVARAIADVIEHPRAEVYPYRRSRLLAVANTLWPAATDRLVRRFSRRREPSEGASS